MAGITAEKAGRCDAESEAWVIKWTFSQDKARNHIDLNLERPQKSGQETYYPFWLDVESIFNEITTGRTDEIEEFIRLIKFVNGLKPRKKWVFPLLEDKPFSDFQSQLFAIVEDYKKK